MVEDITGIKAKITINISVSPKVHKNMMSIKNIIFGILLHVNVKIVDMQQVL